MATKTSRQRRVPANKKHRLRALKVVVPRPPSSLGLLTMKEVADELRVSTFSVSRLIATGSLKAIRPIPGGRVVRIFREDLLAFVENLRVTNPNTRI